MSDFFGLATEDRTTDKPATDNSTTTKRTSSGTEGNSAADAIPAPHVQFPQTDGRKKRAARTGGAVLLSTKNLTKSYQKGSLEVPVLRGVDMEVHEGELVSIIGQSGSGKSTLLHLLGTLDKPDAGEIYFGKERIDNVGSAARDRLRNDKFGMIFQFYHLLPELTMLENVLSPLMISHGVFSYWRKRKQFTERAKHLLDIVGLSHRIKHKPRELSGGEMQRTAIARSLISDPTLLLADEPTGNLDQKSGHEILDILESLNSEQNLTIVMVTHDKSIAARGDRTVQLVEGKVRK